MKTNLSQSDLIAVPLSDDAVPSVRRSFRERFRQPLRDSFVAWGLGLVLLSATIFAITEWFDPTEESSFNIFVVHYSIAFLYSCALFAKWVVRKHRPRDFATPLLLWMVMSLTSCYALNRVLPIFESATSWLCVYLVVSGFAAVAFVWKNELPGVLRQWLYGALAASLVLYLYLAAYLVPVSPYGLIGLILLGVGGHAFIPLVGSISLSVSLWRSMSHYRKSILIGLSLPLLFTGYFLLHWQQQLRAVRRVENQILTHRNALPKWVLMAQKLHTDWVTERILKTDLVYTIDFWEDRWGRFPNRSFDAVKEHDPLVTLAVLLVGRTSLSSDEQIQVLESLYDARHQAQTRLWSGDQLRTEHIHTNVKVFPDYRLAYTEKVVTIHNQSPYHWNQQEAIYTFHLPEGSVVTSLSLWINGVEEEARLTTKAKADSAYTTIVGRERRDPSVVHWQEGNTVTVRVFPCMPDEDRQFKIGITSPLRAEGNRLFYDNIFFQGPAPEQTRENVSVQFTTPPADIAGLEGFDSDANTIFYDEDSYQPDRVFSIVAPGLASQSFVFQGKSYAVQPYVRTYESFAPKSVYLDVNHAWTLREFETVYDAAKSVPVWVWDDQWIALNEANLLPMYEKLWNNRFSLLPVHRIAQPAHALIISKSGELSPNLKDLEDSPFAKELARNAKANTTVRLFNLGHELSPYLKTLTELRLLHYDRGNITYLKQLMKEKRFVQSQEDPQTVTLPQAEIQLHEETTQAANAGSAPDHLLRLFAYNHLMQQIGHRYFEKDYLSESLIAEAKRAYVVSPISSLIVLETQKDYERFGIDKAENSLKNASLNGSGAVPEPHEWLLIITAITVVGVLLWKRK
jgi:XrtN system VIT domain protein